MTTGIGLYSARNNNGFSPTATTLTELCRISNGKEVLEALKRKSR